MSNKIKIPVQDFIDYEMDVMDEELIIDFFQKLVDTKLAWTIGSHYAVIAAAFIKEKVLVGEIPGDIDIPEFPEP